MPEDNKECPVKDILRQIDETISLQHKTIDLLHKILDHCNECLKDKNASTNR
ncbi:unnamed protein product [marine sediment metagenome]|uniref:Uncharacterized protein n=1 Tax=marine sediment metagenome TaxID=412755 RepID=X1HRE2_9ZZZZ